MNGSTSLWQAGEFSDALEARAASYGVQLKSEEVAALSAYYEQVCAWNGRLHLVAPCPPAEFATRHVLESLVALPFLAEGARVADVGSGAGLPIIPCLIARQDISATLIEASPKKAVFLREAMHRAGLKERTRIVVERFEKTQTPAAGFITCRALEQFKEMFERLLAWSPEGCTLLLFAGPTLREEIERAALPHRAVLLPESERRFLFVINKESNKESKV